MATHGQAEVPASLEGELLQGARAIGGFLFGEGKDEKEKEANTRKAYHLIEKHGLPAFKLGGVISARKSTIMTYLEKLENTAQGRQP